MSVFLIASSLVTTLLIPADRVPAGRRRPTAARSRTWRTSTSATRFGTVYDVSTIAILWFAGASAMAGLLNLIPRYLPRYGMAPEWAGAVRPLVLVFTATGVPDHLDLRRRRRRAGRRLRDRRAGADHLRRGRGDARRPAGRPAQAHGRLRADHRSSSSTPPSTTSIERPDGVKIGACFIVAIVVVSLRLADCAAPSSCGSPTSSSTPVAQRFVRDCAQPHDPLRRQRARRPRRGGVRREGAADPPRPRPARPTPT